MQSCGKVKRVSEYAMGDRAYDGDFLVGEVAAVAEDPHRKSVGYVLVLGDCGFSIMRGAMDARQWLCVARAVPESVMEHFARVILGKERPKSLGGRKFPVVEKVVTAVVEEDVGVEGLAPMPYIDAV